MALLYFTNHVTKSKLLTTLFYSLKNIREIFFKSVFEEKNRRKVTIGLRAPKPSFIYVSDFPLLYVAYFMALVASIYRILFMSSETSGKQSLIMSKPPKR